MVTKKMPAKKAAEKSKNTPKNNETSSECPKRLMRFTTLGSLLNMLRWGGIPLYDGSRWDDKCDFEFLKRGCRQIGKGGETEIGVFCCMNPELADSAADDKSLLWETAAHWGYYSKDAIVSEKNIEKLGICIQFDFDEFVNLANENGVLHRDVQYLPYAELRKMKSDLPCAWFFTKRDAFQWEREYRFIAIGQNGIPEAAAKDHATGFLKPIGEEMDWEKLIKEVVITPFSEEECKKCLFGAVEKKIEEALKKIGRKSIWDGERHIHRSGIFDNKQIMDAAQNDLKGKERERCKTPWCCLNCAIKKKATRKTVAKTARKTNKNKKGGK